jgi:hypothetical protein
MCGSIQVTTGTTPVGTNATVATITYASANFANGSFPVLQPANAVTAALSGTNMIYVNGANSSFTIVSGTIALTGAATYLWYYHVLGNN